MKMNLKKLTLAGLSAALLAPALQAAEINLVTVGGNASIKLIQDRLKNAGFLTGVTINNNSTNSLIFNALGTFGGKTVDWEFNFTGGAGAISDIANSTPVTIENNSTAVPQLAISATAPETVGIDSSPYQEDITVVVPVAFVKNSDLTTVSNLTQRQAAYLEGAGATLPVGFFDGSATTNIVYYVGRNDLSAVRQLIDANVYFSGAAFNFTTNSLGQPIQYLLGTEPWGAGSGSEVISIVKAIPYSIGTVAGQDIGTQPTLSYEGVPFTTANVINGSYPLWGYERYIYNSSSISSDQQNLINALESAITNPTYEATSPLFVGNFVSYAILNASVGRSFYGDGGPIYPGGN
jgi:hypothetical protein